MSEMQQMIKDTVKHTNNDRSRLKQPPKVTRKVRKQIVNIPLVELERLRERYNVKHQTHYTYGQFVGMLHSGKVKIKDL